MSALSYELRKAIILNEDGSNEDCYIMEEVCRLFNGSRKSTTRIAFMKESAIEAMYISEAEAKITIDEGELPEIKYLFR